MTFFLLVFILLYGSLHYYFYAKLNRAISLTLPKRLGLALVLLVLLFTPIIERSFVRLGIETPARILSFIGYVWMGVLFLFFVAAVIFDIYTIAARVVSCLSRKDIARIVPSPRLAFFAPVLLAVLIAGYGYTEAQDIRTESLTIKSGKIPAQAGRIRLVQISDVHLGTIVREDRLRNILHAVAAAKPDIIVSTGDLVDGQTDGLSRCRILLKDIEARYGKYAITGNHEFYAGLDSFNRLMQDTGFKILRGEGTVAGGTINIIGIDDPAGERQGLSRLVPEKELLSQFPSGHFALLLKHKPLVDMDADGRFDLQLSGHTHGGQIFPFRIITRMVFPLNCGLYRLGSGSLLYVSRGTGTWGPPIRFLAPPEITVIDLVPDH
jgi:uncharacterized protein